MRLLLSLSQLIPFTYSLGVSLHLLLLSRSPVPDDLPVEYLISGAFYPDCFYNCLGLSNIGEYNHWTPFLYELVQYYDQLPGEDLELKLFIYGILSHQISDVTWHSIRLQQGLLKYINNVEFNDNEDFTSSHSFVDSGGDFVVLDKLLSNLSQRDKDDLITFLKQNWGIPTDHLVNVYKRLGYNQINKQNINYCMLRGYSALQLEILTLLLDRDVVTSYKERSPLFIDIIDDYYLGGLQEISYTLGNCLPNLQYWFKNIDKVKDSRSICGTFAGSSIGTTEVTLNKTGTLISPYLAMSYFGTSATVGKFLDDGRDCVAVSAPLEDQTGSVYIIPLDNFQTMDQCSVKIQPLLNSKHYAPRFGYKLLTFMNEFLVVSIPGLSSLKFYYQNHEILELTLLHNIDTIGQTGLKQFGHVLELDGIDIVVGAPYADLSSVSEQKGLVYILDGFQILNTLMQSLSTHQKMNMNFFIKREWKLPMALNQDSNFENFGSQFTSLKGFTAITVQNLGIVLIYQDGVPTFIINSNLDILDYSEAYMIDKKSSSKTSQFGVNYIKLTEIDNQVYLVISSKSNSDNCLNCGLGYIFLISSNIKLTTKIYPANPHKFDNFFENGLLLSNNTLIISSSSFDNYRGAIWQVHLPDIINKREHEIAHTQLGPQGAGFTGFGRSMAYSYDTEQLIVGMPWFGYSNLQHNQLIGHIIVY